MEQIPEETAPATALPSPEQRFRTSQEFSTREMYQVEKHTAWEVLSDLPMKFSAVVPIESFKVRDLLGLTKGQIIESRCLVSADVSLRIQQIEAGWGEFEAVDQRITVRMTRFV